MDGSFGLIFRDNYKQLLLVKRRDMPVWVLPGGRVEKDETIEQGCIREVKEESGFDVNIVRKIADYTFPSKNIIQNSFECVITGGKPTLSDETCDIQFFEVSSLPKIVSPYLKVYIDDALLFSSELFHKDFEPIPIRYWFKAMITQPFGFFRYTLTLFGIHWNI